MSNYLTDYDEKTLKHVQNVQLMILKDFIKICNENNIEYMAYGGTLLGAIRHNGFIPWDDDIDIIMMREEYEKFMDVISLEKNDKYSVYSIENTDEFYFFLTKFSLNNTEFRIDWTRKTKYKLGICLDIFVFDDVPDSNIRWKIYFLKMKLIQGMLFVFLIDLNKNYPSPIKKIITIVGSKVMRLFGIKSSTLKRWYKKTVESSNNKNYSRVYENIAQTYFEPIPKSIIYPLKKVPFENIDINVPNDYDSFLTILYGDYMKLPPVDERNAHPYDFIDFGRF